MRISTKGRYAMCVMIDLAEHYKEGPVALKDIAARQNISKKYLEQIVSLLNRPDFLKTIRGAQGGYMLA
ncbi:MAG: Rrf2 family transcriptional regulator, partial [Spirochaetales bacterium]|nr:Rrf2 family transcriptional regulator [Spirochaetales bacterium]